MADKTIPLDVAPTWVTLASHTIAKLRDYDATHGTGYATDYVTAKQTYVLAYALQEANRELTWQPITTNAKGGH